MIHVGLIFLCAGPLLWVASPDLFGYISAWVMSLMGAGILILCLISAHV